MSKLALSKTSVTSFNGRKGLVNLIPGDYPNLKSGAKIPGSNLNDLANVDLTTVAPIMNDVLKWNGTNWIPGAPAAGAVGSTEITDLSITGTDIAENTINLTKLYSPSIDSALYLRGDKTWANFTAEVLNAPLSTYVLDATTKPTVGVTDKIGPALGKIQKFLNDLNTDYISKTATSQTVSGTFSFTSPTSFLYTQLPTGASPTEVSNVQYVHNYVGAAVSGLSSTAPAVLTTANGAAAAGDTTLNVVSTVGYSSGGTLLVGSEAISYTGTTGTSFTGLTRGAYGTTAASISNGATINNYLLLSRSTTTSTPKMVVTGSGNVGIGMPSPVTKLDILGTAGTNAAQIRVGGGTDSYLTLKNDSGVTAAEFVNMQSIGSQPRFRIYDSASAVRFEVNTQSNMGPRVYSNAIDRNTPDGTTSASGVGMLIAVPSAINQENGVFFTNSPSQSAIGAAVTYYITDTTTYGRGGLKFKTSNSGSPTTRMTIDSTGNVGIGAVTPTAALHVVSPSAASGNAITAITAVGGNGAATNGNGGGFSFTGGDGAGTGTGGGFSFAGGSTTIGAGGAISLVGGSGDGASGGQLSINSSQFNSGAVTLQPGSAGTNGSTGALNLLGGPGGANGSGGAVNISGGNSGAAGIAGNSGGAVAVTGGSGVGTDKNGGNVTLNGGAKTGTGLNGNIVLANLRGSVGVGTADPIAPFQVGLNTSAAGIPKNILVATYSSTVGSANYVGNWASPGAWGIGPLSASADNTIRIGNTSNGLGAWAGTQNLNLVVGGKVSVGTSSSKAPLYVLSGTDGGFTPITDETIVLQRNGVSTDNAVLTILSGTSGESIIRLTSTNATEAGKIGYNNSTQALYFFSNSSERMRINSDGNVGIGLDNPDERLVVFNGSTTGKYTATGWTHSSDERLKHDISLLENSLEKILKLKGVEYKFNKDPENKTQIGFIAQDVEPIFPEVVETDNKGFKSMVYSNLIAPLVEAVKTIYNRLIGIDTKQTEHSRQIASTDMKIKKLESENQKLKQENSAIKSYLCSKDPGASICK